MSALKNLHLVHPNVTPLAGRGLPSVKVGVALQENALACRFEVRTQPIRANPALPKGTSQWGLWEWDVVEVFLSVSNGTKTYYEFQVSPLGQFFELEIFEPRKRSNKEFKSGFVSSAAVLSEDGWNAAMRIPLKALGWDGNRASIRGNVFAILGRNEGEASRKTYWSLYLPQQEQPDFHLPEYFKELL